MPNYADNFANWSVQTNAMHQFAIWTALSSKIGASLQHYNPLVDQITTQNLTSLLHETCCSNAIW